MRFKHRALAALMALMLCLTGGAASWLRFAAPVYAEETQPELEISAAASPDVFIAPGETTLTFALTNHSDGLLEGVCLTSPDGLLVEPIGDIAAGASLSYSRIHPLSQEELDSGEIRYIITCVSESEHFSYPVSAPVEKTFAEPEVEFLRSTSGLLCADGGSVTVVYRLRNVGNVPVTAITITDPLGSFDGRLESLDVGKSKTFVQHVSVTEPTDSAPVLTYSTDVESDVYTVALDGLTIEPARSMLDAYLTAGRSMFTSDTAEVILQLVNSGNVDYLDISVYDDVYGGLIADSITIPAGGEPVEVAHTYPLRGDSSYRWRVTGRTSAGEQIDLITNTETVMQDTAGGDPLLTVEAVTSMPRISRSGRVPVRLEIRNIGEIMASDVQIIDQTGSEICRLAVVPTGDPIVREFRHEILEDTVLVFSAVYADSFGKERIAASTPLEITIGPGGQAPENNEKRSFLFGGMATQIPNSGLFTVLLIASCLVLIALIVVLFITSRRARLRRKAKKMRIKAEMGKTNRFKPVREKKKSNTKK